MLVIRRAVGRMVRGLLARARRDDSGSEMVQIAIGLAVTAFMGGVLFAAVRQVWPGIVESAMRGFAELFGG
ncbi:MAG: hypothetical protein QOK43_1850 [Acidimicrobiaceae bacterium]|nr:hypothetical protein [Acidimicrobiaceae bacterium]